jgi:UDP-N-acetyl-D-glucosamine dehydrogenase
MSRVVVVGQGYLGLPLALAAAAAGHQVTGLDANGSVVAALAAGRSHVDDVSDTYLAAALRTRRYTVTSDARALGDAEVVLVCVPTPLDRQGAPDLSAVVAAATTAAVHVRGPATVVLESTTHPGTTEEIFLPALLKHGLRLDDDVFVAFSPERVDPGNPDFDVVNTPKVVGGVSDASADRAVAFYETLVCSVVRARGAREAEMAKLLENAFRYVNIALVNEMLCVSHDLGVDMWDAIRCAETKPFGFMSFRPGPGVGGHCIPIDPVYLSRRVRDKLGYGFRMLELADDLNHAAPHYVVQRSLDALAHAGHSAPLARRVLLLGVTYKRGIADCRESPADPVARGLLARGCTVQYHDPYVPLWRPRGGDDLEIARVPELNAALVDADLVVLLQAHPAYDLTAVAVTSRRVLDTRGVLDMAIPGVVRL